MLIHGILNTICSVHPTDIQNSPYSISLWGVLHRGAVCTIFKVFGMTWPHVN